jgi:glycosyltransferase involved in cell wall biosynthesis
VVKPPHVSVVVPIFNSATTIKRAIDSIVAQTFSDLEIIVVDDASTDQGADRVAQWSVDRLSLIRHPHNRGAAAARNTGIAAAHGRWIAFLDSDDTWKSDKLERQIAALDLPSDFNFRACATGYFLHKNNQTLTVRLDLSPSQFRRNILFGCTISPGTTLLVDRKVFEEIGYFDEDLRRLEDWDWLLRFSQRQNCDMQVLSEPLADIYVKSEKLPLSPHALDPVMHSIAGIGEKQLPAFKGASRKQLQSSLLVEKAARLHRAGRPVSASAYVLAGLAIYPYRNVAFFRTLWRAVKSLLR